MGIHDSIQINLASLQLYYYLPGISFFSFCYHIFSFVKLGAPWLENPYGVQIPGDKWPSAYLVGTHLIVCCGVILLIEDLGASSFIILSLIERQR